MMNPLGVLSATRDSDSATSAATANSRQWGTEEPQEWCDHCGKRTYPVSIGMRDVQGAYFPNGKWRLHSCIECAKVLQAALAQVDFSERPKW